MLSRSIRISILKKSRHVLSVVASRKYDLTFNGLNICIWAHSGIWNTYFCVIANIFRYMINCRRQCHIYCFTYIHLILWTMRCILFRGVSSIDRLIMLNAINIKLYIAYVDQSNSTSLVARASHHSRLIPMYNARFILWPPSLSSPIRKKLVNGQMPEMRSQPLKQSLCLATQSQLRQSIATNHEIRNKKFQNFTSILR